MIVKGSRIVNLLILSSLKNFMVRTTEIVSSVSCVKTTY